MVTFCWYGGFLGVEIFFCCRITIMVRVYNSLGLFGLDWIGLDWEGVERRRIIIIHSGTLADATGILSKRVIENVLNQNIESISNLITQGL